MIRLVKCSADYFSSSATQKQSPAGDFDARIICQRTSGKAWIAERLSTAVGFEVLPKRWIVERTFAWLSRFRRLARDFERYARTVAAFIHLAMIRIMLKRLVASSSS
jgi:transposase